jgi:hypothetical protein
MTTTSKKVSEVIENLQRARLTLPKELWQSNRRGDFLLSGLQAAVERHETFGNDTNAAEDGHEVGIADPSRDDVKVEVVVYARTCRCSKIPSDVKALGSHALAEQPLRMDAQLPEFKDFIMVSSAISETLRYGTTIKWPTAYG